MIGFEPEIGETLLAVFGISFIFKVDNTSAGRKLELLGNVGISGEQTAGSDMIHIVPLYVSRSQDAVFSYSSPLKSPTCMQPLTILVTSSKEAFQ